ncbi:glycine-rich protein 3 [Drosophila elegans]|uniref:glycine-rich protein 3 n=1 Tax=Drosophila elegans TaxID=30023 RepID=UPI0007E6B725|nr:glycine-rich protein 3 [Drosophila elegans]
MFQAKSVCLLLALCLLAFILSGSEAVPRPQEGREEGGDQEANVEAEEKDLEGAASFGYGYYSSPYLGGYYGGGYWPHYSGSYYGIGYPYYGGYGGYGGYYGHHGLHGHYGHYF